MTEPVERPTMPAADHPADHHDPMLAIRPRPAATDILPVVPNLLATFAGFLLLAAAPWAYIFAMDALGAEIDVKDEVATMLVLTGLGEISRNAALGALFFAVVIAILQAWRHRRPFPASWPALLAFPVLLALLVPDSLMRGGGWLSAIAASLAIAIAFIGQWGMLVALRALSE